MLVAIYAYENLYSGLHGMNNHRIVEVNSMKEIHEWGVSESLDVIDSYYEIENQWEEDAENEGLEVDSIEWWEYIEEWKQEDTAYDVWEVIPYASIEKMEHDFWEDKDTFVKEHCKKLREN